MLDALMKQYNQGNLIKQVHPELPLTVWNYSDIVQYDKRWNPITLMARGLVTDDKGNIVARSFPKFFNIEERDNLPSGPFEVYEKMDGSLIIAFFYNGRWNVMSRGSFDSHYAWEAEKLFLEKNFKALNPEWTYTFELIGYETIVVRYPEKRLILLAGFETSGTGELSWNELISTSNETGFELVQKFEGITDFRGLKEGIPDYKEGYVIKFWNGDRVKIKGYEYVRLHKIRTSLSTKSVWEALSSGTEISNILVDVPDEIYGKIRDYADSLQEDFDQIKKEHEDLFSALVKDDRKKFAIGAKYAPYPGLLFSLLDGKDIDGRIWKILEPTYKRL